MNTRIVTLFVLLSMLLTLAVACKPLDLQPQGTDSQQTLESGTTAPTADPVPINVYTMNGTTGFGLAKLMEDAANGAFATERYNFQVKSNFANDVLPALINGDADIAAIPTNGASIAYNRTNGAVKVLAINTLGCLYVIGKDKVDSLSDLNGKTIYAPTQNPTFIFQYLCAQNGVSVTVDNTYAKPKDLAVAIAAGKVDYAVLPEPMITIAKSRAKAAGRTLEVSIDLTAEWNKLPGKQDTLVQGCVVVRTAFLAANPQAVANFLKAYEASIAYLTANVEETAKLIVKHKIFDQEAVAKTAIPNCNVAYMAGTEMKNALNEYLTILHGIQPSAIGGKVPDEAFYYLGK